MYRNEEDEEGRKETVYPMLYSWRNRRDIDGCRRLAAGMRSAAEDGHRNVQQSLLSVRRLRLVEASLVVGMGALGCFLYSFMVKALNTDIDARYTRTKAIQYFCGLFTVVVALSIHLWAATLAWFSTYLGPRIGAEAAITAVTAYQDDMLPAILPMYVPMLLFFGIHFVMLLVGKTRYPRRMLVFHPVTWNLLLVAVPDIAQAMQVPTATWMSVMSQSSTNTAIVIWCIAAAVYERNHT